jgi:hypothetical protein
MTQLSGREPFYEAADAAPLTPFFVSWCNISA